MDNKENVNMLKELGIFKGSGRGFELYRQTTKSKDTCNAGQTTCKNIL